MHCSVSDTACENLVLRVCGSTRHGQIVRLRSEKCTIGAGPRCTLRLRARGVRPIHCLIVRGSRRTLIRQWAPDTRLNGRTFTDAELVDGDRLGIGPLELEVLDAGLLPPEPARDPQFHPQRHPSPQLPISGGSDRSRIDRLTARLALANRQGRQRVRRLLGRLRSADEELTRLRQSQTELPQLQRQHNEQAEALNARSDELDLQREALQRESRDWKAKLSEAKEQLRQRTEQCNADQAELEAQREDLQQRRRQWEAQQIASESRPEEPGAESEPFQSPEPLQAAPEAPIDISDVFLRMGSAESSPAEDQAPVSSPAEEQAPEHSAEPESRPPDVATADQPSLPSQPRGGEEESIADYMARLLDRVHAIGGESGQESLGQSPPKPEQPSEPPSPPQRPPEPALTDAPEMSQPEETALPQPAASPESTEISPRAAAPEKRLNLSAMRDLANLTAHTAIDRHAQQQARHASWGRLLVAVVGIGVGAILLWIWRTTGTGDLAFHSAMASFLVALLWTLRYAYLTGQTMLGKSGQIEKKRGRNPPDAKRTAAGQAQRTPSARGSDSQFDDSAQELEHDLQALVDAWHRE